MLSTTIPDAMTAWMESVTAPKEDTETDDATDGTETPADDTGADEAPADDAVAEETPADDAAVDETPAEETPADDAVADETPADDAPAADENKEVRVKVNIKSVKVREKASTSSDVIAGAEKGDTFTKLGETDGWTKIDYNGKIGYIKSDYVDEVTE